MCTTCSGTGLIKFEEAREKLAKGEDCGLVHE